MRITTNFYEFGEFKTNLLEKKDYDELAETLRKLKWWEPEEDNSQFTGVSKFYGFDEFGKEKFLKDGDTKYAKYLITISSERAEVKHLVGALGDDWSIIFESDEDYKDFSDKVLWNNTFGIHLEPDDKVRVFKTIPCEDGLHVREQEIADEGVKRLINSLKEMHWLKDSLRDCEHRYFGFTDSGMENVKVDSDISFHHSYYFALDENGYQATLKDFMEEEYILRFPNDSILKKFFDEVITPNLFTFLDEKKDEGKKTPTIEDIMKNISFVKQKAVSSPKPTVENTLERIAVELRRQNDIHEIEVMVQCANAAMQSLIQHKNGKEREDAWDFVDDKIKTATNMITNMVNGK